MDGPNVAPPVVKTSSLHCPNCGGTVKIRGFAHTLNVVCTQCMSVLDATTPELVILQKSQAAQRYDPVLPLGSRGKLEDGTFEVIGFQIREVEEDGEPYHWSEYLLFNPYKGFRYLTEFEHRWNYVRVQSAIPEVSRGSVRYHGTTFNQSDHYIASTTFVLGEFPWQVRVGETVQGDDYSAPPKILSREATANEVTWSLGEARSEGQVFGAFQIGGASATVAGVAPPPQPPRGMSEGVKSAWKLWLMLTAALLVIALFHSITASRKEVFRQRYSFSPGQTESSFTTSPFDLSGGPANIEVAINSDIDTHSSLESAAFGVALVNSASGQSHEYPIEVDNFGKNSGPRKNLLIPGVDAGKYYLRVEQQKDTPQPVNFDLIVRRGVPTYGWFWMAFVALLIPPIFKSFTNRGV